MKNDELLKANSKNEDYPNTDVERIGYAVYATIRSLEPLSPAIRRLQRCEEMFKLNAPNIIKHHEAEEALKYLAEVKQAIDDAYNETWLIYHSTNDGVYNTVDYFMGKSDMHVVAIVKGGKVKVKGFKDMKEAIEWAEQ